MVVITEEGFLIAHALLLKVAGTCSGSQDPSACFAKRNEQWLEELRDLAEEMPYDKSIQTDEKLFHLQSDRPPYKYAIVIVFNKEYESPEGMNGRLLTQGESKSWEIKRADGLVVYLCLSELDEEDW